MKKTDKIVTVELLSSEIKRKGFDRLWDEVRDIYPVQEYDIVEAVEKSEGRLIEVTLRRVGF